jgi:hypothetical protein
MADTLGVVGGKISVILTGDQAEKLEELQRVLQQPTCSSTIRALIESAYVAYVKQREDKED